MSHDTRSDSRLAGERSPFLLHGATQPVDWWPWGEHAFRLARDSDRPLLLDIGAVWCHWCHVMDRESYEDPETAALINALFVPVKVDRDEKPDVDARYQRAVQVLTGQGGWPLTAFLTPDGDVFYGGTYFPPDERHGRPSFRRVLREVARIWTDERTRALDAASGIRGRLEQYAQGERQPGEPRAALLHETYEELANSFDFRWGGFGRAPKFPNPGALDLLLDHWVDADREWAHRIVTESLLAMGRGGIFDQLAGGFHRYATDARWIIPHFEKMAYDNGPLLATYAAAHAATGEPFFARVANDIVAHYLDIAPDLVREGGFPASQDADYGNDNDGDYWTWTDDELRVVLGHGNELNHARLRYGLDDEAGAMHVDPARHVLFLAMDDAALAGRLGLAAADVETLNTHVRTQLKQARGGRPAPLVDTTVYAGWSALLAAGHLAAARWMDGRAAGETALRALDRTWNEGFIEDSGILHRVGDPASGTVLEDQAFVLLALLDAFEYAQDEQWLDRARTLANVMIRRFHREDEQAFGDRPVDAPSTVSVLERPHMPIADSPTPSGNGAAALALLRLAVLTGDEAAAVTANGVLRSFAGSAARLLASAATWMKALAWAVLPVTTVTVVDDAPARDSALLAAALRTYRPRTVVRLIRPAAAQDAWLPPEVRAMVDGAHPRAYICAGRTCAAPVQEAGALGELLRTFRGG